MDRQPVSSPQPAVRRVATTDRVFLFAHEYAFVCHAEASSQNEASRVPPQRRSYFSPRITSIATNTSARASHVTLASPDCERRFRAPLSPALVARDDVTPGHDVRSTERVLASDFTERWRVIAIELPRHFLDAIVVVVCKGILALKARAAIRKFKNENG